MERQRIRKLPKLDLHCHLDGSLSREFLQNMLGREIAVEELQVEDECKSLAEYLKKFDLPLQCLQTREGLKNAGRDLIQSAAKENIKYVEVRFAPLLSENEKMDCGQIMEAVLEGLEEGRKIYHVESQVIACAMRHHTYEQNKRMIEAVREFYGKGLCAFDLAGNEAAYPMENFVDLFRWVDEMGIPFTIHAGECGRVENVMLAVKTGALRIGHGIALAGNKEAIRFCREKNIGIEMCPSSNLQTKAVKKAELYPIREFLEEGLKVTLNTDNRTVSHTSIGKEIELVQKNWGITDREIFCMMENAIDVSFAGKEIKEELKRELKRQKGEIGNE